MAALIGGASGAAGAGGMGAAGAAGATGAATTAASAAPAAYGAGTYGVMASNAAPATYQIPGATYPSNYVMQSSQAAPYQIPQAYGGMLSEQQPTAESFMHRLMEYARRNPSQAPDRSQPSAPNAQQAPPPQYSHLLGQSGMYPTLSSLMAVQLPALQTRA